MPLNLSRYARADGDSYKFDIAGDTIEGTITHLGEPFIRINKFNSNEETVFCIGITPNGGDQLLIWPRLTPLSYMAEAIMAASDNCLTEGGTLKVQHHTTEDTGKGNPAKLYRARYEAPTEPNDEDDSGPINGDDDEDPF